MDVNAPPPHDLDLPGVVARLVARAKTKNPDDRRDAIEQMYELAYKVGPKVANAIPMLIDGLADPDPKVGESSLWALHYCQPDSIEPLIGCLTHPLPPVRERAAHSLGSIGEDARMASPALRRLLTDQEPTVRSRAAWALGLLHDAERATVAALVSMISNGTSQDRHSALHALGNIGKAANDPTLLTPHQSLIMAALNDWDGNVRRWALYAIESLPMDPQSCANLMVTLVLRDESSTVREAALSRLKELAPMVDLSGSAEALLGALDKTHREASLACEVLAMVSPKPMVAVSRLHQALGKDQLVLPAAAALWKIEQRADAILPALERVFDDYDESVCDLICALGPAAAPMLPKLIEALSKENWDLQWAAADALGAVASSDMKVVTTLLDALSHPSPIVRSSTARALAKTGPVALPALRSMVVDRSDPRGSFAAYALGEMGAAAAEALPDLRAGMKDDEAALSRCCAIAVVQIAGGVDAVPYLIEALQGEDASGLRRAAASALGQLGPAARDAAPALEALLDEEDFDLHQAAAQALAAIRGAAH